MNGMRCGWRCAKIGRTWPPNVAVLGLSSQAARNGNKRAVWWLGHGGALDVPPQKKTRTRQQDDAVAARRRGGGERTRWQRDDEVAAGRRGGRKATRWLRDDAERRRRHVNADRMWRLCSRGGVLECG